MPTVLQKLMRHDSIETTLRYYVDLDADAMAEELWKTMGDARPSKNADGEGPSEDKK